MFELLVGLLLIISQRVFCSIIECEEENSCNNAIFDGNRDDISFIKCFGTNSCQNVSFVNIAAILCEGMFAVIKTFFLKENILEKF